MLINITQKDGTTIETKDKHVSDNLTVVPVLDEVNATPSESTQTFTPGTGFAGFDKVIVAPIPSEYVKPEGTLDVTENGTYDVSGKASAVVNVEPKLETKVVDITENGTTEVTPTTGKDGMSKVTVNVNVPSSGGVEEVATASAMDALLVEANVGKYYKFTGPTDTDYTNGDLYLVEVAVSSHTLTFSTVIPTIDGVAITSPYTLTKDCTIVVWVTLEDTAIKINGVTYYDTATISIANQDIAMELVGGNNTSSYTVTINYTA